MHGAYEWLRDNEAHVGADTWEWDLRDYDIHFLFTVYCIELGVRLYVEHKAAQSTEADGEESPQ